MEKKYFFAVDLGATSGRTIIGGLDEYAVTGDKVKELIAEKYSDFDYAFIGGRPS